MTRPPILRYVGPVPYVRCFSSVRPDRPRKRAASGVRRKRGGRPASGSGIIALRDLATSRRIAAAGPIGGAPSRRGMVKTGGLVFATPGERPLLSQQVEIAALHQLHTGAHQANSAVAQVVCLPAGTRRKTCVAE